jgi:hypothetical protein
LLAEHGHVLVGLYEGLLTDFEVVTIWATDPAGHEALMRHDAGGDERFARWHEQARAAGRIRWREELMTPHPDSPLSQATRCEPGAGVRSADGPAVIESSLLGPGELTSFLPTSAPTSSRSSRRKATTCEMTWPIVEGESLMHLHIHRGSAASRSICATPRRQDAQDG